MCYFEQHIPCQALHSGVARPMRSGYPGGALTEVAEGWTMGLGEVCGLALASSPKSGSCSLRRAGPQHSNPLIPGKHSPPGLPSNNTPGCIATRIWVPGLLSPALHVRPLPTRAQKASRLRPVNVLQICPLSCIHSPDLGPHSPRSGHRYPSRGTSLENAPPNRRLNSRGVGL